MTICGTDEYMAPEMLFDESFSYPADMFSFGKDLLLRCHCPKFAAFLEVWFGATTRGPVGPRTHLFFTDCGLYLGRGATTVALSQENEALRFFFFCVGFCGDAAFVLATNEQTALVVGCQLALEMALVVELSCVWPVRWNGLFQQGSGCDTVRPIVRCLEEHQQTLWTTPIDCKRGRRRRPAVAS